MLGYSNPLCRLFRDHLALTSRFIFNLSQMAVIGLRLNNFFNCVYTPQGTTFPLNRP